MGHTHKAGTVELSAPSLPTGFGTSFLVSFCHYRLGTTLEQSPPSLIHVLPACSSAEPLNWEAKVFVAG